MNRNIRSDPLEVSKVQKRHAMFDNNLERECALAHDGYDFFWEPKFCNKTYAHFVCEGSMLIY